MALVWSPWWTQLPTLRTVSDYIAGLQGKITPSDEQQIRQDAAIAIHRAGGTESDVQQVQQEITSALESYGGSSLSDYGGSPWPNLPSALWIIGAVVLAGVGVVILFRD